MGAKARIWIQRAAIAVAIGAGAAGVALAPLPAWSRLGLCAAGLAIGLDQAFRRVPAFDPLGRIRWRLPRDPQGRKTCAITFDDGPSPSTADTLDILAAAGVQATFFVLGGNALRHPELVRRAQAEGHALGLHGMRHTTLATATDSFVGGELDHVMAVLKRLGVTPSPIYRTPHGYKSRAVFTSARRRGLTVWAWSRGIWDTDRPAPDVLVRRATRFARSGLVLLLHDGHDDESAPDVQSMLGALPHILSELKRRGFTFVKLTDVP